MSTKRKKQLEDGELTRRQQLERLLPPNAPRYSLKNPPPGPETQYLKTDLKKQLMAYKDGSAGGNEDQKARFMKNLKHIAISEKSRDQMYHLCVALGIPLPEPREGATAATRVANMATAACRKEQIAMGAAQQPGVSRDDIIVSNGSPLKFISKRAQKRNKANYEIAEVISKMDSDSDTAVENAVTEVNGIAAKYELKKQYGYDDIKEMHRKVGNLHMISSPRQEKKDERKYYSEEQKKRINKGRSAKRKHRRSARRTTA